MQKQYRNRLAFYVSIVSICSIEVRYAYTNLSTLISLFAEPSTATYSPVSSFFFHFADSYRASMKVNRATSVVGVEVGVNVHLPKAQFRMYVVTLCEEGVVVDEVRNVGSEFSGIWDAEHRIVPLIRYTSSLEDDLSRDVNLARSITPSCVAGSVNERTSTSD